MTRIKTAITILLFALFSMGCSDDTSSGSVDELEIANPFAPSFTQPGGQGIAGGEVCTPTCTDAVCGDDGCGGSCGSCLDGLECSEKGTCVPPGCVPSCVGKACGDDGCGGFCGICGPGTACQDNFTCGACSADCTGKACGDDGCGGTCGDCPLGSTCAPNGKCACAPDCTGKECGDDGCGGLCGACPGGQFCTTLGSCANCVPNCLGKQCGDDGCGGTCGVCAEGLSCSENGTCGGCQADCTGKHCGDDGCGGLCGGCPPGKICGPQFFCIADNGCVPDCAGKQCGFDGCSGLCGSCPDGQTCDPHGLCKNICLPNCNGKHCGDDGCGGSCGKCPVGKSCGPQFFCISGGGGGNEGGGQGGGLGGLGGGIVCSGPNDCQAGQTCCDPFGAGIGACLEKDLCPGGVEIKVCTNKGDCAQGQECCEPIDIGVGFCISEGNCPGGGNDEPGEAEGGEEGGNPLDDLGCSVHAEPGCGGCACEACVCDTDPFCCNNSWDLTCVNICTDDCGSCGGGGQAGGDGCVPQEGPGCGGCGCESCVCEADPFCCNSVWDDVCVDQCTFQCDGCGPTNGGSTDGCQPSDIPGCDGCECEECVCSSDSFCCEFSWDETCATSCKEDCGSCGGASGGLGDGCQTNDGPGCNGCECESCVCDADPFCCNTTWDEVCVDQCTNDCGSCGGFPASPETDGCTAVDTPGCGGCPCEDCVCGFDSYCCQTAWDETCVEECTNDCDGCGQAAEGAGQVSDGCSPLDGPGCGGCACEQCVCSIDSFCCDNSWDELCVDQCTNDCGGCGEPQDENGSPDGCTPAEGAGCIDCICETCVCNADPFCCSNSWDDICVEECTDCGGCGSSIPGSPDGCTPSEGPGCEGCSCEECTCNQDEFCCNNAWDQTCVNLCNDSCGGCGGVGNDNPSDGCTISTAPGCEGCDCEACVCADDPFCCNNAWDSACVSVCEEQCGGCGGNISEDGCTAGSAPGCGGCPCEACVCQDDPFCCNNAWDDVCVDHCTQECGGCGAEEGGGTQAGDGCVEQNVPGCGGCECEDCVCAFDSFCCQTVWDSVCATQCAEDCGGCGGEVEGGGNGSGTGCEPSDGAGCGGCGCESCVCETDSYCCDTQWDSLCVDLCTSECGFCGGGATGSPDGCTPAEGPGCNGCECESCVCGFDSFCCESAWDEVCVSQCTDDCGGCAGETPGGGDGCTPSDSPGCDGCGCESCVCDADPFCCTNSWDDVCVTQCTVECNGCGDVAGPKSDGCTPSQLAGCDNCACETCVCDQDSFCCLSAWDSACVDLCTNSCGGCGGETGGGTGSTDGCTPSDAAGCGGCPCESCVCSADPYCCNNAWDDVCVDQCTTDCGGCGGAGEEGGGSVSDGCTPTDAPGCGGCACESCVCSFDTFCCSTAWDQTCVNECTEDCGGCGSEAEGGEEGGTLPGSPDGCTPADGGGCNGCACESCVCGADSYCCDTQWDSICVQQCTEDCGFCGGSGEAEGGEGGTPGSPDGCTPAEGPGCNGCACESCVCAFDNYCCGTAWDNVCVTQCTEDCGGCGGGTGGGPADSCAGNCDGQAPAGCWCDESCADFGDCCDDNCAQCGYCGGGSSEGGGGDPNSCSGNCDGQASGGCWCDSGCADFGDCCDDICGQCGYCGGGSSGGGADPNSCSGNCDGQAPGGCWCDNGCADFGDCCGDICGQCGYCGGGDSGGDDGGGFFGGGGSDDNSCSGNCGGQAPGGCYCDSGCANFGDCCSDACFECGAC